MVEHPEVGIDVEGEAVHRSSPAELHADGGDLPRCRAVGIHPDAGVGEQATGTSQPEVGQDVDEQLLDRPDVGDRVGHAAAALARAA